MLRANHPGSRRLLFLCFSGWVSLAPAQTAGGSSRQPIPVPVFTPPGPELEDGERSDVAAAQYSQSDYVEKPVASPGTRAGFYPAGTSLAVTLSTATPGATIHYTLDMSFPNPGQNTLVYTGPIILTKSTVVKAVAVKPGMNKSSVVAESYNFLEPLSISAPSASPRPRGARFHPRWAWEREGRRLDGARR